LGIGDWAQSPIPNPQINNYVLKLNNSLISVIIINLMFKLGIGDWGLGIAQSPIPNPQSPIYIYYKF